MKIKPIIIVAGEPYSTFLEIFFKSYKSNVLKKFPIILIASKKNLTGQMKKLGYKYEISLVNEKKINKLKPSQKKINLINIDFNKSKIIDKISKNSKNYIEQCFKKAIKLLKEKKSRVLINGPISKIHFLNKKYPGITEYLSKKTNKLGDEVMLIYNEKLSVSPITTHISLKDIFKNISINKIIKKVDAINYFYKKKLNKKAKFAITGLNPHCESKNPKNEEKKIILPAIKILKKKKINIQGPFPADTMFLSKNRRKFNVIIGMYHDQVLTPIKTLYEFKAINITLGLPFIRISPDHGTNNKMLGKKTSDPSSLIEAFKFIKKVSAN